MLENALQRKIQKYLKDNLPESVVWKNHGNQYSVIGLPDIICVYKGKIICIEAKIQGNKPTKLQEITLQKLKIAGAIVGVAYNIQDVKKILKEGGIDNANQQKDI